MRQSIQRSITFLTGFIAMSLLASCSTTTATSEDLNSQGIGGTGEETPIATPLDGENFDISQEAAGIEVDALLRSQQSHHILNGKFAANLEELEVPVSTDNFDFQLINLDNQNHAIVAKPKTEELVAYAGGINVGSDIPQSEALITCAATTGTDIAPPTWTDGQWSCAEGSAPAR